MKRLILPFILLLLISCENDVAELADLGSNAAIIGTWVEDGQLGDTLFLVRSGSFDKEKYGFSMHDDGTFIEHKNAGWCGTPPISYDSFEGSWEAVSDSLLDITVAYWGGVMTYQIRIVSLHMEELAIRYLYSENRMDALQPD